MLNKGLLILGYLWLALPASLAVCVGAGEAPGTAATDRQLIENLSSSDAGVREQAAKVLAAEGPRVVPLLAPLLDAKDPDLAMQAGWAIGQMSDAAVLPLERAGGEKAKRLAFEILKKDLAPRLANYQAKDTFTVEWREPEATWPDDSEVLIATGGYSHGNPGEFLNVLRILPAKEGATVRFYNAHPGSEPGLEGERDLKARPGEDLDVRVETAPVDREAYRLLLRKLALLEAVHLERDKGNRGWAVGGGHYVVLRVLAGPRELAATRYAGGTTSYSQAAYARPLVASSLAQALTPKEKRRKAELSEDDRVWIAGFFKREWPEIDRTQYCFWAHSGLLALAAGGADRSVLPELHSILKANDVKERSTTVYWAIQAARKQLGLEPLRTTWEETDLPAARDEALAALEKAMAEKK